MRIGIIGSGIAGMTCAHVLHREHEIEILEAGDYVGGHTCTTDLELDGRTWPVDSGFIVFNRQNYPNFLRLIEGCGVRYQPTRMSFSVTCERTGLEYGFGGRLDGVFAQRRNLVSPGFWRMLLDIRRFRRTFRRLLEDMPYEALPLREYMRMAGYSEMFVDQFLIPFGAAIWSAPPHVLEGHPLQHFVRFFRHHGFLEPKALLQWYVIKGGSREYVMPLTAPFADQIRLRAQVMRVRRLSAGGVEVLTADGERRVYDRVVLATHSDQALAVLEQPTPDEQRLLSALAYQENDAVIHTDTAILPRHESTWASWNYRIPREAADRVQVTYNMNILQSLDAPRPFLVSLNPATPPDEGSVLARKRYAHPVFTPDSVAAQREHAAINGVDRIHYAGAYWGYGFHEDGVNSGLAACAPLGATLP